ncbi:trimethylamine---corrinoid protein Co-methyltransferase [Dethiosulfatibacter aminovorans DSM 17477]|uniref:Trimethylamine---corrinoid protein Co-methyltransferase n=1 Tax=Dethiosulfatibacter aminovorans DSM 17477 TaxID=1121476 RepID=A0A1M6HYU0_9FIRM|nr:trimethylamine methyltransferase family protein [Dethiosulfatibacter aminovorans]SHJ27368.1 trimethylamine---corrinoid protein Co-methyltransferase [Dethiosulfatibacter aminovorans DSM 17477]
MQAKGNFVTNEDIQKIHEAVVNILSEKGVRFYDEKALKVFRENGAKVEDEIVYIDKELLNKALATVPDKFELEGRDSKYNVTVGGGDPVFCPAYGPVFVKKGTETKSATCNDMVRFTKLVQSSKTINMLNPYVVTPQDIDVDRLQMYQQAVCLKYGTKPTMGITAGYDMSKKCIKLIKDFYDKHDKHVVIGLCSALSPLSYDEAMIGGIFAYAEENQPIIFGCGALPGATSPVTLAGTMAVATSELLAGIVLAQLINPGVPVVFGNVAASTDLRYVTPAIGTPEAGLIAMFSRAITKFYGIPCRGGGALSDSKLPDMQAGIETMFTLLPAIVSGIDYVIHACGILDSFNIISYEKFIIDEQSIEMTKRFVNGFEINDDTLGLDTIKTVDHGGQYLEQMHTAMHFRNEHFAPKLFERASFEVWEKNGSKTVLDNALAEMDSRLEGYSEPEMTERQKELISEYLNIKGEEKCTI